MLEAWDTVVWGWRRREKAEHSSGGEHICHVLEEDDSQMRYDMAH